jgi:hypothetical protein
MFSRFFIERPIFATVLSLLILIAGGVALVILPIARYPEITPPAMRMSSDSTVAKIGRSMKNRENIAAPNAWVRAVVPRPGPRLPRACPAELVRGDR